MLNKLLFNNKLGFGKSEMTQINKNMLIAKLSKIDSLPEMISIFVALNFVVQISFKLGFLSSYGYWSIALFNPIEIMLGNLELLLIYILIFSYIFNEDHVIPIIMGILTITVAPFLSSWLYGAGFNISPLALFGIVIGSVGIVLKKKWINTSLEMPTIVVLLIAFPLLYGLITASNLQVDKLAKIKITEGNTVEQWFIIDKFSDSFLTINSDKTAIKIIKLDQPKAINLPK